jgi:hypothetical protein
MILGLDISTSITGATVIDENGKVIHNEAWDLRKYKEFFQKAEIVKGKIWELDDTFFIKEVYIEQSLQSFRSGFSSAKTLSILSRFNGVVSWLCYDILKLKPEYIAATSARKKCGIKVPKGTKAKQVIIQYVLDNVPSVLIEYTKHGNPKPHCFDKADSWVIANAGYICQTEKSAQS